MAQTELQFPRTFYWFDFETFGLDPKRDRPAQFAGLRTDENLNQLGKPDVLYCQLSEDYLPNPEACLVTGITPMTCMEQGVTEAEFAKKIYDLLSEPMTISIGYNNFKFDDEVVRHMFWRNLLEPYKREWDQGCARMDLYRVVQAVFAFKPDVFIWPRNDKGELVIKLEEMTKANNLVHENPHDAASDAISTMLLAKQIKEKEPRFWDYAVSLTNKKLIKSLLGEFKPLLYASRRFGEEQNFMAAILPLGINPHKPNQCFCWNLAYDPQVLQNLTLFPLCRNPESDRDHPESLCWDIESDKVVSLDWDGIVARIPGAKDKGLPLIDLKLNDQPFLVKYNRKLCRVPGLTPEQVQERAKTIFDRDFSIMSNVFDKIKAVGEEIYPESDEADLETSLYSTGFLDNRDRCQLERLRNMDPDKLAENYARPQFINEELTDMIARYVARNYPGYLTAEAESAWEQYKIDHLINGRNQARTFNQFFEEVNKKLEECPQEKDLLKELYEYGQDLLCVYQQP